MLAIFIISRAFDTEGNCLVQFY